MSDNIDEKLIALEEELDSFNPHGSHAVNTRLEILDLLTVDGRV